MRQHYRGVWTVGLAVLLGLCMVGGALAQQPPASQTPPAGQQRLLTPEDRAAMGQIFWHRMQERLGLSDQQATDIRGLLDGQRAAMRTNMQGLMAARKQMQSLLAQPTVDTAAVQAAAAQVKTQQAALFDARLQTQLAIRAKLTQDQWQQWQTLHQGHRRAWMMRRGPAFGMGM